jgi:MoxR-like ATPase
LAVLRGVDKAENSADRLDPDSDYPKLILDAMIVALSGRIHLDEAVETTPERVLREIWEDRFILTPAAAQPG